MLNPTLLKRGLASGWKLFVIFAAVLTMYMAVIAGMYDPEDADLLNQLASLKLSPELLSAFGFVLTDMSLAGFLASYYYGMLMLAFPMVLYIMLANRLVASMVEKGSMASILSAPVTRRSVAVTQGFLLILSIGLLVGFVTGIGIAFCEVLFPGSLDIAAFLRVNLGVFLLHTALGGVCFFSSCLFNDSRKSLALGAGLPVLFYIVHMLRSARTDLTVLKYLTPFSVYDPHGLIAGDSMAPLLFLLLGGLVLYAAGVFVFDRKDLSL